MVHMIVMNSKFLSYMWELGGSADETSELRVSASCSNEPEPEPEPERGCVPCLPFGFFHFPRALVLSLPSFLPFLSSTPAMSHSHSSGSSNNIVGAHYRVGKKIGEGSFGVIFEGGPFTTTTTSLSPLDYTHPGPSRDRVIERMK